MHASAILSGLALCRAVAAIPAPGPAPTPTTPSLLAVRNDDAIAIDHDLLSSQAEPTAAWVSVDDLKQPKTTFTPSATVVGDSTSYVNAAPLSLTASVYTYMELGVYYTTTGVPPNPKASSNADGKAAGYFSRCHNLKGEFAPFCRPSVNSTIRTDSTYYVTWDPDYFLLNKTLNSTGLPIDVYLRLEAFNPKNKTYDQLEIYKGTPAAFGFFPWEAVDKYRQGRTYNNVTLTLYFGPRNLTEKYRGEHSLPLALTKQDMFKPRKDKLPKGATLALALGISLGGLALIILAVCFWNRDARRIQLGNVMSRSRHGYNGREQRRGAFGRARKDNGIQLDNAIIHDEPLESPPLRNNYRDAPDQGRRDSDALGSLAGSPVRANFEPQGTTGGRNAFREEMDRQHVERQDGERF